MALGYSRRQNSWCGYYAGSSACFPRGLRDKRSGKDSSSRVLLTSHTHLIFAGSRENEFQMRVEGASPMEISDSGNGILTTVRETRRARVETLVELGLGKA